MSWITQPISRTCEYLIAGQNTCAKPTSNAYKSHGMGWMALCDEHAKPHLDYAPSINFLVADGEKLTTKGARDE